MGEEAWAAIRQRSPLSSNTEYSEVTRRVAGRLLRAGGHDTGDWEFAVFAGDQVNAFALPGRKIGVYEGMLDLVTSEGQLAAVIGHEIGHIEADHSRERMSAQMAGNAALRVLSWLLDLGEVEFADEIAAALGVGVEFGVLRPYGRGQEEEADLLGLHLMRSADYQGEEAVALWQRMAARGQRGPDFLSTHPAPQSRIEALQEAISVAS
ncbi:TPR repeat-containing protein YfgC precursor [Jannaschia aquimarina]|uniref:YfgC_2 protein n=2 Tax=Jannaschia aquimarina TaxID=935700 RepID=A0A0D1CKZ9_9RHOB|nr:TPR repeat-containing protein YfgC precursor [Jannaschia aquimarina]SNT22027.1 Peptidase family M48 [Jannaschia aquimarina]